jgi:hypothetical protein
MEIAYARARRAYVCMYVHVYAVYVRVACVVRRSSVEVITRSTYRPVAYRLARNRASCAPVRLCASCALA